MFFILIPSLFLYTPVSSVLIPLFFILSIYLSMYLIQRLDPFTDEGALANGLGFKITPEF